MTRIHRPEQGVRFIDANGLRFAYFEWGTGPLVLLFHGFPDWGRVLTTEPVDTVRLDDIAATSGVELLKLDIQGAELMALRHAQDRLRGCYLSEILHKLRRSMRMTCKKPIM